VAYIHDSSNDSLSYSRNRIRHEVMPALRALNPALNEGVGRLSGIVAEENAYLEKMAREALMRCVAEPESPLPLWGIPPLARGASHARCNMIYIDQLVELDQVIRRRTLRLFVLQAAGIALETVHVEVLERLIASGQSGSVVDLPGGYSARVSFGQLIVERTEKRAENLESMEVHKKSLPKTIDFGARTVHFTLHSCDKHENPAFVHKTETIWRVDYDKLSDMTILRSRKTGDHIRPAGRGVTKSLKKLAIEHQIDAKVRNHLAVLATEDGRVIWAEAFGVDEAFAVDEKTRTWVEICFS